MPHQINFSNNQIANPIPQHQISKTMNINAPTKKSNCQIKLNDIAINVDVVIKKLGSNRRFEMLRERKLRTRLRRKDA
jgi:hypothetical protein